MPRLLNSELYMANHNFIVRAGFTVCVGGNGTVESGGTLYAGGAAVVLSDAEIPNHLHKLTPADSDAISALAALAGSIQPPSSNVY